jgi:hypothetical protein
MHDTRRVEADGIALRSPQAVAEMTANEPTVGIGKKAVEGQTRREPRPTISGNEPQTRQFDPNRTPGAVQKSRISEQRF